MSDSEVTLAEFAVSASRLIPDDKHRRSVFEFLADSIMIAAQHGPGSWGLTLKPNFIRLNVGRIEVITIRKGEIAVVLSSKVSSDLSHAVETKRVNGGALYKSVPDSFWSNFSQSTLERATNGIRASHDALIIDASSTFRHQSIATAHSPGMVSYIAEYLGRQLPLPTYATEKPDDYNRPNFEPPDIKPGDVIDNAAVRKLFAVGNMGGMRRSLKRNLLVLVSDHTKSVYVDRWESNVLHYTGMGKNGPQTLTGNQNLTLYESRSNGVTVHLFEVFEAGRYVYVGEVSLAGEPYQEEQAGEDAVLRDVWMFPISATRGDVPKPPQASALIALSAAKERALAAKPLAELKHLAKSAKPNVARRIATTDQPIRNPYVAAYVKKAALGKCDLCAQPAPFEKDGEPFLHCHHVVWLSKNGPDVIQNAVAICPNCHERMHQLDRRTDVKALLVRIAERDPDLS